MGDHELYLHLLNTFPPFGPKRIGLLMNFFSSPKLAFEADLTDLVTAGLDQKIAEKFLAHRSQIRKDEQENLLNSEGIQILSLKDARYPMLLKEIPDPPPILYIKGKIQDENSLMLAVVGTRKISTYGRLALSQILPQLIESGVIVVSGMAFGIDSEAHKLALELHKPTVAVLASGLDEKSLYPKDHQFLAMRILENNGSLISEYPPKTPAFKQNFVARNRVISGLAKGVLIVECGLNSGSLITANFALDQNRPVYAVPGPIYSHESQGTNNLLKQGAVCTTSSTDILQDWNIEQSIGPTLPLPENEIESKILTLLQKNPLGLDELSLQSGLESSKVSSAITILELKGYIKGAGGGKYVKTR